MQNFNPFQPVSDAINRGMSAFYGSAPVRNVTNLSREFLASPFTSAQYAGENLGTFSQTKKFTDLLKGLGWAGLGASEFLGVGKLAGLAGKAKQTFPAVLGGLGFSAYKAPEAIAALEARLQQGPTTPMQGGIPMGSATDMWNNYTRNLNSLQEAGTKEQEAKQFSNVVNSMYDSDVSAANKAYSSELENLRKNLELTTRAIGQEAVGTGQDISTAAAQVGMDTSPSLDVAKDYLAQQAAIKELGARADFEKKAAEAQARKIKSTASAAQARQRELAKQNLTTFGLILQALQGGM